MCSVEGAGGSKWITIVPLASIYTCIPHEEAERRVEESNEVRIFVKIMHRGLYDTDV